MRLIHFSLRLFKHGFSFVWVSYRAEGPLKVSPCAVEIVFESSQMSGVMSKAGVSHLPAASSSTVRHFVPLENVPPCLWGKGAEC